MTTFEITYKENDLYHAMQIIAADKATATAYFMSDNHGAELVGIREATEGDNRPGKPCLTVPDDFKIETEAEKRDRENWEHCKYIAEEIERYTEGNGYKCPHCGEIIEWDNDQYSADEGRYTCPECGKEFDESDLESVSVYDYFDRETYDIEYRIGSDRQYRSVRIMIACGGPNIYIDTARKAVILYWWTEHAEYSLLSSTCEVIDQYFEELFNC